MNTRWIGIFILLVVLVGCSSFNNKTSEDTIQTFLTAISEGDKSLIGKVTHFGEEDQKEVISKANERFLIGMNVKACNVKEKYDRYHNIICDNTNDEQVFMSVEVNEENKGFFIYDFEQYDSSPIVFREDNPEVTDNHIEELEEKTGVTIKKLDQELKNELSFELLSIYEAIEDFISGDATKFVDYLDLEWANQLDGTNYNADEFKAYLEEGWQDIFLEENSSLDEITVLSDYDFYSILEEFFEDDIPEEEIIREMEGHTPIESTIYITLGSKRSDFNFFNNIIALHKQDEEWKMYGLIDDLDFETIKLVDYSLYNGKWKDGKRNGDGRGMWDYTVFDGTWKNGKPAEGKLYDIYFDNVSYMDFPDESTLIYEGEFSDGMKSKGIEYSDGTLIYEGEWKDDRYNGQGSLYTDGHIQYEGEFKDGRLHGKGIEYSSDGKVIYEGDFNDGDYVGKTDSDSLVSITEKEFEFKDGEKFTFPIVGGTIDQDVLKKINQTLKKELEMYQEQKWYDEEYSMHFDVKYEVPYQSDEVLSIIFHESIEKSTNHNSFNFRLSDGELIILEDVLMNRNITTADIDQVIVEKSIPQHEDAEYIEGFEGISIEQPYYFTDDGLEFVFAKYVLGMGALAWVNLPVSWNDF